MMIADKKKQKGIVSKVRGAAGSLIQAGLKAQRQMEEWSHHSSLCHALCSVCSLSTPARMMGIVCVQDQVGAYESGCNGKAISQVVAEHRMA
jgi:hypothetical protein